MGENCDEMILRQLMKIKDWQVEVFRAFSHGSERIQPLNLLADLQMPLGARVLVIAAACLPQKKASAG